MGEVDEYLAGLPDADRAALERVCDIVREMVPEAEQSRSYGMPAWRHAGRPLLGLQASSGHLAVYPFSTAAVAAVADDLPGFSLSKGTVRFSARRPIPAAPLRRMVALRRAELESPGAGG